jgi:hypothetical protein
MSKSIFLQNETYARLMEKDDLIISRPADRDPSTMQTLANLNGIPFVVDEWAPKSIRVQFRKPRSKKARIRKKWAKDARNWKMVNVMWIVDTSKLVRFVPPPLLGVPYYQHPHNWAEQIIGLDRPIRSIPFGGL